MRKQRKRSRKRKLANQFGVNVPNLANMSPIPALMQLTFW